MALALIILTVVSGCGGASGATPSASPEETARCLKDAGVTAKLNPDDTDILAVEAPEGAVVADWSKGGRRVNRANVSFWRAEGDAEKTQGEYETFAESQGNSQEGRLFRAGTVLTAFKQTPSEDEKQAVERCLG